ncbi:MAG: CPXCG motif-containing cysteine-rich protein [Gammaproteobacteria bacterium]|nr:CPXCG motif-containing cysteine-rich protein [Gammaproteobacteria bacterium]
MLTPCTIECPYCGESFESSLDASAGSQHYIEDCYVCCRPIEIHLKVDSGSNIMSMLAKRDDE